MPDERVRDVVGRRLDGIPFHNRTALLLYMRHGRLQQLDAEALSSLILADEKAGDGPDLRVVHRLQDARALERRVVKPCGDGTPADWFPVEVAKTPRRRAGLNGVEQEPGVAGAFVAVVLGPRPPPEGTPAAAAGSALAEERFEVVPAVGGQRVTDEFRGHGRWMTWRGARSFPLSPGFAGERVGVRGRTVAEQKVRCSPGDAFPLTPTLSPAKPGEREQIPRLRSPKPTSASARA